MSTASISFDANRKNCIVEKNLIMPIDLMWEERIHNYMDTTSSYYSACACDLIRLRHV